MHVDQTQPEPPSSARRRLDAATDVLLHADADPGSLLSAAEDLALLFEELTGVGDRSRDPANDIETTLDTGVAISPRDAARCVLDQLRTRCFLRGVFASIESARARFGPGPIDLLYAGCGPYATLVTPLLGRFAPEEIRVTLLDIHEHSLSAARCLIERLGFQGRIHETVCADASTYRHPSAPHVIVAETLQRGLAKEPQLAITANLAAQLRSGGLFVPERITVKFCLADSSKELTLIPSEAEGDPPPSALSRDRRCVATLLELTPDTAEKLLSSGRGEPCALPPVRIQVPDLEGRDRFVAQLLTHITVHKGLELDDYDSGLTYPIVLDALGTIRGGETLELWYELGTGPGFRHRRV